MTPATKTDTTATGGATLTATIQELAVLRKDLADHTATAKVETDRLQREIQARRSVVNMAGVGLDHEKIALARTVLSIRGTYAKAGDDRASVIYDAVNQLATGIPARQFYADLWLQNLGTKDYSGWHGQRCDCEPGMGPRHGSVIFSIGFHGDVRKREPRALTAVETEAAIYLLLNLERVQSAMAQSVPS